MTEQEIIYGNKLIKQFESDNLNIWNSEYSNEASPNAGYDKDRNPPMTVVPKIESPGRTTETTHALAVGRRTCTTGGKNKKAFNIYNHNNGGLKEITPIYKSVVEFIKWYNENKK